MEKTYTKGDVGKFLLEFARYLEDEAFRYVHANVEPPHQQAARKAIFWSAKELRATGERYARGK